MERQPVVAGRFYPGGREELDETVRELLARTPGSPPGSPKDAKVVIAPHAGYVYSGAVAADAFSSVRIPDRVILIGPNHTGAGERAAVMASGSWRIPTGSVEIDDALAASVINGSALFKEDARAHGEEHSLEVELPFIHHINPAARIVPITLMGAGSDECREMGRAVAKAVYDSGHKVLVVVSSDMNHYEPQDITKRKDDLAINCVLNMDAEALLRVTKEEGISMCGVVPAAVAIEAAKALGATSSKLVGYATSGETSGDFDQVVGYAAIMIN